MDILNNPDIKAALAFEQRKDQMVADLADCINSHRTWQEMDGNERKVCVRAIVSEVESEDELKRRLCDDLGLRHVSISWHLSEAGDKTGDEARVLVKALGGLVPKNGALVMLMTSDEMF